MSRRTPSVTERAAASDLPGIEKPGRRLTTATPASPGVDGAARLRLGLTGASALGLRILPRALRPKAIRDKLDVYSAAENWMWARSLGRRFHVDKPIGFDAAKARAQGALASGERRLSAAEREQFLADGYLRPFRVIPASEATALAARAVALADTPGVYGFASPRDLHLVDPSVRALFRHPAIVDRLVQLMGADLGIWRSELFHKAPGSGPIMTHHATVYRFEDLMPVLRPDVPEALFQLTVWIALSDAHVDNGCMYVIPGTHTRPITFTRGGDADFYGFDAVRPDPAIATAPVPVELRPGEAFIFSERVLHGSYANTSDRARVGLNARVIRSDVRVHEQKQTHFAKHHDQTFDLSRWGVWPIAGVDRHQYNPAVTFVDDATSRAK
jgi:chlorinating enzyme